MEDLAKTSENKTPQRDPKTGQLLPGNTANPNGRPKGFSIVELLKKQIQEVAPGKDKKTYAQKLVEKLINKAIEESDMRAIQDIIDRVDGKATENVNLNNKTPITKLLVEIVDNKANGTTSTQNESNQRLPEDSGSNEELQDHP